MKRFLRDGIFLLAGLLASAVALWGGGEEVVVLYNSRVPASKEVAEHYALQRLVPKLQVIGLDLPDSRDISRADYTTLLQDRLITELQTRDLARWSNSIVPAKGDVPARTRYTIERARFRYLLLTYGMPYFIPNEPGLKEESFAKTPGPLQRNDACVDSELMLLPAVGHYDFVGIAANPVGAATNGASIHPGRGVFMVSRLDGPTPAIARELVNKAVLAEQKGLWGHAYIDLRGLTDGPYKKGDTWITNAAQVAKRMGFETFVDNRPEVLPIGYPLSQVGLYFGWYDGGISGPFRPATVEFMNGAFAYHLHSFSAHNIRASDLNWVGPFLARGVTATMGCVNEPYLDFTPHLGVFLERWGILGMTFGEAATASIPGHSWQTIVIGDPLYRPFARNVLQFEEQLDKEDDALAAYAKVRKVNIHLLDGRDPEILRQYLEQDRRAITSAVISEKVAQMYAMKARLHSTVDWAERALRAPDCTRIQRLRILQDLTEYRIMQDKPKEAFEALEKVAAEYADYADLLGVRKKQLRLARDMSDAARITAMEEAIRRLTPPTSSR
jgi:uncharacterized protein (TIGR03790 family)